jgi:hypothetical protein
MSRRSKSQECKAVTTPNVTTADAVRNGSADLVEDLREMRWVIEDLRRTCEFEESEMDYLIIADVELLDATWCRVEHKLKPLISLILSTQSEHNHDCC